jgi:mitogen-activated protein kinase kinase kinase 1
LFQKQTKIWLGEVLHLRFDEDVSVADLLADGELL